MAGCLDDVGWCHIHNLEYSGMEMVSLGILDYGRRNY